MRGLRDLKYEYNNIVMRNRNLCEFNLIADALLKSQSLTYNSSSFSELFLGIEI